MTRLRTALPLAVALALLPLPSRVSAADRRAQARFIAAQVRPGPGICLDLGCGDAGLAIELARQTSLTLRCIEPDDKAAAAARAAVDAAGLYGARISLDHGRIDTLAYPDYCANLVVCGDGFSNGSRGRDPKEIRRVLNPNGVALIGGAGATRQQLRAWLDEAGITTSEIVEQEGVWARITRPRPTGADEWTHRNHDAANTFGSTDPVTGPPFKLLWATDCPPTLASAGLLLAGGRQFVLGYTYAEHPETTPSIHAYDAYNGLLLWKREGKDQLPADRSFQHYAPEKSCSDIAATADLLYVLGGKLLWLFDSATGEVRKTVAIPETVKPAEEDVWLYISCVGDTLYCGVGPSPRMKAGNYGMAYRGVSMALLALDRFTGKVKWSADGPALTSSLCIGGGRLHFYGGGRLHALDARTGRTAWTAPAGLPPRAFVALITYYEGNLWVLYSTGNWHENGRSVAVFSADTGASRFQPKSPGEKPGVWHMLSFANGLAYASPQHASGATILWDSKTGDVRGSLPLQLGGCSPIIATPRCIFARMRGGPGFLNLETKKQTTYEGLRPTCFWPPVPANGMLYIPAPGCGCPHAFRANVAMFPGTPAPPDSTGRLVKGTAFAAAPDDAASAIWATWRNDAARSGITQETARTPLRLAWTRVLPAEVTPVAATGRLVLCAGADHKLRALDLTSGDVRWEYVADGRIEAAPYLWRGRVYVGDDDGWVHCVRANDGALAWRFRAALAEDRIIGYGAPMSRWPVGCGGVVHNETAYFAAGLFPADQVAVYALNAQTGEPQWEAVSRPGSVTASGPLAVDDKRVIIPSRWGPPKQIRLDDPKHAFGSPDNQYWGGGAAKGPHAMLAGEDVIVRNPGLVYTHHVGAYRIQSSSLPIVTGDTLYLRDGRSLTAEPSSFLAVSQGNVLPPKKQPGKPGESTALKWKAWGDAAMTAAILAGDTIFSGGTSKVYATAAADGKELWSADVPGPVRDLAVSGGRLIAVCGPRTLCCFAPASR